jgi:hypothetical protein
MYLVLRLSVVTGLYSSFKSYLLKYWVLWMSLHIITKESSACHLCLHVICVLMLCVWLYSVKSSLEFMFVLCMCRIKIKFSYSYLYCAFHFITFSYDNQWWPSFHFLLKGRPSRLSFSYADLLAFIFSVDKSIGSGCFFPGLDHSVFCILCVIDTGLSLL